MPTTAIPSPTFFLDVAGRFSRTTTIPMVVAGVAVQKTKVDELRNAVLAITGGRIIKWTAAHRDIKTAKRLLRCIEKHNLVARVTLINKHEPEWTRYWTMGDRLEVASRAFPQPMPYATASVTLKYHIYCHVIGDVLGVYLSRHRRILPPKGQVQQLQVQAVCDSDIHGEENLKVFRNIFKNMGDFPQTREATGIVPTTNAEVMTEQDEPLLMLPDHLAGYIHSKEAYGQGPENDWAELIKKVGYVINRWPSSFLSVGIYEFVHEFPIPVTDFEAAAAFAKTDQWREVIARVYGGK